MKEKKQAKMTVDTLAVIIKKEFDNVNDRIDNVETRLNDRIDNVETRLNDRIDSVETGLNDRIDSVEKNIRDEIRGIEQNLREEFITSSDKIIGKLEIMREEHAASFGLYKELEQKVFTLEQRVDELSKQMKQLQLKFSHA